MYFLNSSTITINRFIKYERAYRRPFAALHCNKIIVLAQTCRTHSLLITFATHSRIYNANNIKMITVSLGIGTMVENVMITILLKWRIIFIKNTGRNVDAD